MRFLEYKGSSLHTFWHMLGHNINIIKNPDFDFCKFRLWKTFLWLFVNSLFCTLTRNFSFYQFPKMLNGVVLYWILCIKKLVSKFGERPMSHETKQVKSSLSEDGRMPTEEKFKVLRNVLSAKRETLALLHVRLSSHHTFLQHRIMSQA